MAPLGSEAIPSKVTASPSLVTRSPPAWALRGSLVKLALTSRGRSITRVQSASPLHAPSQPVKREPALAAAERTTASPRLNGAAHVVPQTTPDGTLVTVPSPVPPRVTVTSIWRRVFVTKQTTSAPEATGTESERPLLTDATTAPPPSPARQLIAVV